MPNTSDYELKKAVVQLQNRVDNLERTLDTLINWMSQSANSPIRLGEAAELLQMLNGEKK